LQTEIDTLNAQNFSLITDIDTLKTQNSSFISDIDTLKTHNASITSKFDVLKTHALSLTSENGKLKTRNLSLSSERDSLSEKLDTISRELQRAQGEVLAIREVAIRLKACMSEAEKQVERAQEMHARQMHSLEWTRDNPGVTSSLLDALVQIADLSSALEGK